MFAQAVGHIAPEPGGGTGKAQGGAARLVAEQALHARIAAGGHEAEARRFFVARQRSGGKERASPFLHGAGLRCGKGGGKAFFSGKAGMQKNVFVHGCSLLWQWQRGGPFAERWGRRAAVFPEKAFSVPAGCFFVCGGRFSVLFGALRFRLLIPCGRGFPCRDTFCMGSFWNTF